MRMGVIAPQGWTGEFDGWEPQRAWTRTVEVSLQAERLGFESVWLFDHFHTVPRPTDEITFESFTALSALAALTERVRLGHIVICNGFRNPALTAKMASTLDAISGGRFELGIGAGWKRDEWLAYGYGFPDTPGAPGHAPRRTGGDRSHARGRPDIPRHVRGHPSRRGRRAQRPQAGSAHRDADHGRRQRAEGHLAAGRALRRRAEPRRALPGGGRRGAADHPRPMRRDRARSGDPRRLGPCLVGVAGVARARVPIGRGSSPTTPSSGCRGSSACSRHRPSHDAALDDLAVDAHAAAWSRLVV